jgi:diguanylate cyclase (GGDEF)-like protein
LLVLAYTSFLYIDFLKSKRDVLALSKHKTQALSMQRKASSMILLKQKSTVAMALSIASDRHLIEEIKNKNINEAHYKNLIEDFKKHTLYKNIWVQVIDKDLNSLYRSWSHKRGDSLKIIRPELNEVIRSKKLSYSVSVGKFDLCIRATIPLFEQEKFMGILEVISHFNSISKELQKSDIYSAVVVKKEFKKHLEFPFTKLFIDDYYVANFDAPKEIREYLKDKGIEKYFTNSYKIENGYIVSSYEIKNNQDKSIAYFIMFKKIDTIPSMDLDFFMFKWLAFGVVIVMGIAILISSMLFFANKRQKEYYHNIIDSSTNIVLINDTDRLIDANRAFFEYFKKYNSVVEFEAKSRCIGNFFVEEEGCLNPIMSGEKWVAYLAKSKQKTHKIKLDIFGKIYYFSVSASKILKEKNHFSIILTDITEQENYKKELERLNITDSLTKIGNRRYFEQKMQEEIQRAKRYPHPFSLLMFDIDFFKQVNDNHGHNVGDEVLIKYTEFISSFLREGDVFCRIGGEEFMIILPHVKLDDAQKIAQKLRVKIQESKIVLPITMSFGVVEYVKGESIEYMFKRVDAALYKAKKSGRNIVVVG